MPGHHLDADLMGDGVGNWRGVGLGIEHARKFILPVGRVLRLKVLTGGLYALTLQPMYSFRAAVLAILLSFAAAAQVRIVGAISGTVKARSA